MGELPGIDQRAWMGQLFLAAKGGSYDAWGKLVELGRRDLVQWLTRHGWSRLAAGELVEIAEDALSAMGLRFSSIDSWPQAWVYSRKVAESLMKDRLGRRRVAPVGDEASEGPSSGLQEGTDVLDLLEGVVARLSAQHVEVLCALARAVLHGENNRRAAQALHMSLRSFERTKQEVLLFCARWLTAQERL